MRIGVVTIYNGRNFGAYLQAYALKKYLESKGNDVFHIDLKNQKLIKKYFFRYINKRWFKSPIFAMNYIRYGKKKYKIFLNAWKEFSVVSQTTGLDVVVLGSDEIWNTSHPAFKNPLFFGVGLNADKVISYAASIGSFSKNDVPDYVESAINSINNIMVRDKKTYEFAKKYTNKQVDIVCDPTLLYDFENAILPKCTDRYIENNKYILIYAYKYSEREKDWVIQYSKKNNLKIVTVGFYEQWCDYCINCAPLEFMDVIKKSELVYTSSFHCAIFAIYNNKKMVVRASGQKVKDLLYRIGAEKCLINNEDEFNVFEDIANCSLNWSAIMKNILDFREASKQLLDKALDV